MRLKSLRRRGTRKSATLSEKTVLENPFEQFSRWFNAAKKNKISMNDAMALATASLDAVPAVRIVLLKGVDNRGFLFYTNLESRKGKHLAENPQAALLFHWPQMGRQIRIEGSVEKLSRAESFEYFKTRPRGSQIGAWASRQSEVIKDRPYLETEFRKVRERYLDSEVPLPDHWGGFRLVPGQFEFWQDRPNRLHDRIVYLRDSSRWKIVRLSP